MRFGDPRGPLSAMHPAQGQPEEACGAVGEEVLLMRPVEWQIYSPASEACQAT